MEYLQTNDPVLIRRRNGQSGDELKEKIDHITVVNNVAILHEVPNKFERVYIEGLVEKITDYYNMDSIKENEYIVDYNYGYVYFNPVQDNKTFVAKYKGEGMILYPASRIYDAKDVDRQGTAKTLQELIDAGRDSLKAVGDLHGAIETANRLYTQITENVKNIGDIDKQLKDIIEQGKDLLRQLTEKISQGIQLNSELKEASLIASNKKNELDNSIQQGTNIDEKLKNTSLSANSINDTLNGNILEGKNKIKEINDKISETDNKVKEILSNERIRQNNEETRENEENIRKSNENKRIEFENTRENKFKLMENTINDFSVCEEYSNRKQYKKYNRVTFNGSCYECIKDCSNIQPVDKSYWVCIAKKGRDGDGSGDMLMSTYDTNKDGVVDNAERVNGHTVECNVPQNAKFTDTIYDDTKIKEEVNRILYARGQKNGFAVLDENGKIPKENIPTDLSSLGDMKKNIYDANGNGIVDNAEKVNGYTVDCNVPRNAKFTDTIYNDFSIKQDIRKLKTDMSSLGKIKNINGETGNQYGEVTLTADDIQDEDGYTIQDQVNISKEKFKLLEEINKKVDSFKFEAENITVKDNENKFDSSNVEGALKECITKATTALNKANEAFQSADRGKSQIANVVGQPLSASDQFNTMSTKIQTMKNAFVENLSAKGQSANQYENLYDLILKIKNINTGKRFAKGKINKEFIYSENNYVRVDGLNFKPSMAFVGYYKRKRSSTIYDYETYKTYLGYFAEFGGRLIYWNPSSYCFDITHDKCNILLSNDGFVLNIETSGTPSIYSIKDIDWIAIE